MQSLYVMILPPSSKMYEIVTLPSSLVIFSPSTIALALVWLWFRSGICWSLCLTLLRCHTMTRSRGTPCWGGRHGSIREVQHHRKDKAINNGYDSSVLPLVCSLIKDWESPQVAYFLAMRNYGNQINFYWSEKYMLINLVENVLSNWSTATSSILDVRGLLVHLDAKLASLDASLAGEKYSLERCSTRLMHPTLIFSRPDVVSIAAIFPIGTAVATSLGAPPPERLAPSIPKDLFAKVIGNLKGLLTSTSGQALHDAGASLSQPPHISNFSVPSTVDLLQLKRVHSSTGEVAMCNKSDPLSPKIPP